MRMALILCGIIFLIVIWLGVDFLTGQKKHLSTVKPCKTPMLHGEFEIFTHGKELFRDYFAELRRAKHHIHVLFYIVGDDAISREFFSILAKKAAEGVEVRLLLDRLGSLKVKMAAVAALKKSGAKFAFSNRVKLPFLFYSAQVRNHRKISIIDGRAGYIGGFNIGKEYIDGDPKLSPWRDYHLKISGEGVNFLQTVFLRDWNEYGGESLQGHAEYFPKLPKGNVRHQFIPTEAGQLEGKFIDLLRLAENTIIIGTPYFIPSRRLFNALLDAVRRGVSLTVLVPFTADHPLVQEASFRYLRRLLAEDAVVYQFKNGFYHAKTIVIDDKICDIGTANFDQRSIFLNKEINCYLYDTVFIARLKDILAKDIQDSAPLSLDALNRPNLTGLLKEGIARVISYFL